MLLPWPPPLNTWQLACHQVACAGYWSADHQAREGRLVWWQPPRTAAGAADTAAGSEAGIAAGIKYGHSCYLSHLQVIQCLLSVCNLYASTSNSWMSTPNNWTEEGCEEEGGNMRRKTGKTGKTRSLVMFLKLKKGNGEGVEEFTF